MSYRLKLFLALSAVAGVATIVVAAWTLGPLAETTVARIERGLQAEARLAAELLSHASSELDGDGLDTEADRLGSFVDARVTFIAADGRVLGDSAEDPAALAALDNHGDRPEVVDARTTGIGTARRYSTTVDTDMLYVAAATRHPSVAVVRFALPLTDVQAQVQVLRSAVGAALAIALAVAVGVAWVGSALLTRRLHAIAAAARRYAAGQMSPPAADGNRDEIGDLGRVLDESARTLADRVAELGRARARLEAVLAGMVEGVMVVDADGRLQRLNESSRRLLGEPGRTAAEGDQYLHVVRHPGIVQVFDRALAGSAAETDDIVLPGGAIVAARAVPLRHGGAVLVLHDITRLKQADRVRRDFIANASHELRTPLTAIRGYAEALRDEGLSRAERERFLDVIARNTERMTRLVQDLLRLARLDSGQETISTAPVDVAALCDRVVLDLEARAAAKQQQIVVSVEPGAERFVSDEARLEEILRNLVENAINYAPPETDIHLTVSRRDRQVELTVRDRGPGIPEADLQRIFERFYRVDQSRTASSGGTGLGLAIVKHLVERLGGRVNAANQAGGGAVFIVRLPDVTTI